VETKVAVREGRVRQPVAERPLGVVTTLGTARTDVLRIGAIVVHDRTGPTGIAEGKASTRIDVAEENRRQRFASERTGLVGSDDRPGAVDDGVDDARSVVEEHEDNGRARCLPRPR